MLGLSGAALSVTKSIITIIAATVTIVFLTFFMLLEGKGWVERVYSLFPEESQPRWRRVGDDIYETVGGYVTGNILISLIAGTSITIVLLIMGVPYAVALGLLVAFLDLIPLAGATIAGIIVAIVAFLHSVPAGIVAVVFVIVYQQLENHFLQPVIYGRTVQLSPLVVLISVLVGAELAGILGALAAIPVAGSLQVIVRDQLAMRRGASPQAELPPPNLANQDGGTLTGRARSSVEERRPSKPLVGGSNPPGRMREGNRVAVRESLLGLRGSWLGPSQHCSRRAPRPWCSSRSVRPPPSSATAPPGPGSGRRTPPSQSRSCGSSTSTARRSACGR